MATDVPIRTCLPYPKQREILRAKARSKALFMVIMCGRRWGKTELLTREAIRRTARGQKVAWYVPSYDLAEEVWEAVETALERITTRKNRQKKRLKTINGGVFEIWSLDRGTPPRGRAYHFVIVDEAAHCKDLEGLWRNVIVAQLGDYNGEAWFISTPWGRNFFYDLYVKGQDPSEEEWISFQRPSRDNPYLTAEAFDRMEREIAIDWIVRQEMYAEPTDDGTNPYGSVNLIRAQTLEELTGEPVVGWGLDVGRFNDATALVGFDADCKPSVIHRWVGRRWTYQIDDIAEIVGDDYVLMDSTGAGQPPFERLQELGTRIYPYNFTTKTKQVLAEAHIYHVQRGEAWFAPGVHKQEAEDWTYTYKPGRGVSFSHKPGKHDDVVIAACLGDFLMRELGYPRTHGFEEPDDLNERLSAAARISRYL